MSRAVMRSILLSISEDTAAKTVNMTNDRQQAATCSSPVLGRRFTNGQTIPAELQPTAVAEANVEKRVFACAYTDCSTICSLVTSPSIRCDIFEHLNLLEPLLDNDVLPDALLGSFSDVESEFCFDASVSCHH